MLGKKLKPVKCRWCGSEYIRWNSTQTACGIDCAVQIVKDKQDRILKRDLKLSKAIERKDIRQRKDKLKTRSDWLREAQTAFNQYIRERDRNHGCISCDENIVEQSRGGNYDSGHYRSRGSAPELRFNEDNCFKQCKKCNRQLSGNAVSMRGGILKRIGLERLEAVEGSHNPLKLNVDDIKEIKQHYKQQLKLLRQE